VKTHFDPQHGRSGKSGPWSWPVNRGKDILTIAQESKLAPTILIGQACLQLRRQARQETAARYHILIDLASRLQAIVYHLEDFLKGEID
jgi:hypothetical protein